MDGDDFFGGVYAVGGVLTGLVTFGGIWLYAIDQWGLLLGLVFGWIPAAIAAVIIGFLWPIVLIGGIILWYQSDQSNKQYRAQQEIQWSKNAPLQQDCIDEATTSADTIKAVAIARNQYTPEISVKLKNAYDLAVSNCKIKYPTN